MGDIQTIIAVWILVNAVILVSLEWDSWQNIIYLIRPEAPKERLLKVEKKQNKQKAKVMKTCNDTKHISPYAQLLQERQTHTCPNSKEQDNFLVSF